MESMGGWGGTFMEGANAGTGEGLRLIGWGVAELRQGQSPEFQLWFGNQRWVG